MWTKSNRLNRVSGSNSTSTSTSLSGRKSSRRTEPKSANSRIFHLRQNASICSCGTSTCTRTSVRAGFQKSHAAPAPRNAGTRAQGGAWFLRRWRLPHAERDGELGRVPGQAQHPRILADGLRLDGEGLHRLRDGPAAHADAAEVLGGVVGGAVLARLAVDDQPAALRFRDGEERVLARG